VDSLAKQEEVNEHERLVMASQLDRHDKGLRQLAAKVGIKLTA